VASMGRSTTDSVRPDVNAYGRTRRGPADTSRPSGAMGLARHGGPGRRVDHLADAVNQNRHLVADLTDVRVGAGECCQVRAVSDTHEEQVTQLHLDDGTVTDSVRLDDPARALYMAPWVWHELTDFAQDTAVMVVASSLYENAEYLRDYDEFKDEVKGHMA